MVFIGDSITERWPRSSGTLFKDGIVGRGIGGQTSAQMLVRFRQDVITLRPAVVHILAGINDIAGNAGPTTLATIEDNILTMLDFAGAHGIQAIVGSVTPTNDFPWRPGLTPTASIASLNAKLKDIAGERGLIFIDYYAAMANPDGSMRPGLSEDGVHPNAAGYAIMTPLVSKALTELLQDR